MATLKGISTKLRGTAGEWTFYNRLGATVAKQKVDSLAPRRATEAQLANRVAWSNLVAFWSAMDGLLVGTFTRKGRGQTDYNAFMSHNLGRCDVFLTRNLSRDRACLAAPYIVSHGNLPTVETIVGNDGRIRSDIALGEGFVIDGETTIGDFSRAVLMNNKGYLHGDLVVSLAVEQVALPSNGTPRLRVHSALVQLDACSAEPLGARGDGLAAFASVDGCLGAVAPIYGGMAWMHVRAACNTIRISTQSLAVTGLPSAPDSLPYLPYTTPEARQAAIESYKTSR